MDSPLSPQDGNSRRSFLLRGGAAFTGVWIASQWPAIAAAAHHAEKMPADASSALFEFLTAVDASDVEALCAQIVPSGVTPGAREAHAVYFIDKSLSTYFAAMAPEYRRGLAEFQAQFRALEPAKAFAAADARPRKLFLKQSIARPFLRPRVSSPFSACSARRNTAATIRARAGSCWDLSISTRLRRLSAITMRNTGASCRIRRTMHERAQIHRASDLERIGLTAYWRVFFFFRAPLLVSPVSPASPISASSGSARPIS